MLLHLAQQHKELDLPHNKEMPFNRTKEQGPTEADSKALNWIMDNTRH